MFCFVPLYTPTHKFTFAHTPTLYFSLVFFSFFTPQKEKEKEKEVRERRTTKFDLNLCGALFITYEMTPDSLQL